MKHHSDQPDRGALDQELPRNQIHIWPASLDATEVSLADFRQLLTPEEDRQTRRRVTPLLERRAVFSRAYLRLILAHYLGRRPTEIELAYRSHGKPYLASDDRGLRFNVSHSADRVLYAIARDREVGIDIESIRREVSSERIARRFFSPSEVTAYLAQSEQERTEAFFRAWTRKEAFIKVTGAGLSRPLHQFDVSLDAVTPARLLATRPDPREAHRWILQDVEAPVGYLAALATEGPSVEIRYRDLSDLGLPGLPPEGGPPGDPAPAR